MRFSSTTHSRTPPRGDAVAIASRERDVKTACSTGSDHRHEPPQLPATAPLITCFELGQRDAAIWRVARAFRPDVMVGFGGICISHVGKLLGIPSMSFYDTEIARSQMLITLPFISEWHIPASVYRSRAERPHPPVRGPEPSLLLPPAKLHDDRSRALKADSIRTGRISSCARSPGLRAMTLASTAGRPIN